MKTHLLVWLFPLSICACAQRTPMVLEDPAVAQREVAAAMDDWHQAAAQADEARYFGHMAPGAIFLGTDATERWTLEEFRTYAHPHFSSGKGWKFAPRQRHVTLADDGVTAWLDEVLDSASYGTCRGTGVLRKQGGAWRIAQYAWTIPVPNDLAAKLVAMIRAQPTPQTKTP